MKKADSLHLSRVAALGCIVCRNQNLGETPAEIHHIRTGQGASVLTIENQFPCAIRIIATAVMVWRFMLAVEPGK